MKNDMLAKYHEYVREGNFIKAFWLARENFPDKAQEVAEKALETYLRPEVRDLNYDNALEICVEYFPEKVNRMAYLYLEDKLKHLKKCALDSFAIGNTISLDSVDQILYDQIRTVAKMFVGVDNTICFFDGESYQCEKMDVEARIREIKNLKLEKNNDPAIFLLKQDLAQAIEREDYGSATSLKEVIVKQNKEALVNFDYKKYIVN